MPNMKQYETTCILSRILLVYLGKLSHDCQTRSSMRSPYFHGLRYFYLTGSQCNLHFQRGHVTYRYGSMVTDMSISYNLICKSALEFLWIIKTRISTQTYRTRKKGLYVMKCEERNLQDPNLHIQGGHVTYLLDWYFE
jgi:hypothetical protein